MIFNLSESNSIANKFIAELRDTRIQQDRMRFRRNMERIGEILAFEISKTIRYKTEKVETPLGIAEIPLPSQQIVIATILRAGLPLHQGILNYFDQADNAFISAYRLHHKGGTFEINLQYVSCPDLENCVLIVTDPMLATGASMDLTLKALMEYGKPSKIHVVTAIASTPGLNYVRRLHKKVSFWVGAIDEELTARSYIVPGLGDAGDLAYGSKMQD